MFDALSLSAHFRITSRATNENHHRASSTTVEWTTHTYIVHDSNEKFNIPKMCSKKRSNTKKSKTEKMWSFSSTQWRSLFRIYLWALWLVRVEWRVCDVRLCELLCEQRPARIKWIPGHRREKNEIFKYFIHIEYVLERRMFHFVYTNRSDSISWTNHHGYRQRLSFLIFLSVHHFSALYAKRAQHNVMII